jgi:hypothetical protein
MRSFFAFILACLTVSAFGSLYSHLIWLTHPHEQQNRIVVIVRTNAESDPIGQHQVEAIKALHLSNTEVTKFDADRALFPGTTFNFLIATLLVALVTAFVLFFYKVYCRLLRVTPHL